jgi:hypothetical protein
MLIASELIIKNTISEILFDNKICESLEDQILISYVYDQLYESRLLYGQPVTIPELRSLLRQKILNFKFIKLSGEIRPARGTTMMKYIPQSQHPKGIRPSSPKVATFFDLDKTDWRSVSQRSKEIVLQKDEETQKPVVMIKDTPEKGDVAVGDTEIKPVEEPVTEPTLTTEPIKKPKTGVEVKNIKPIESTDRIQMFHFINPVTGASRDIEMSAKEAVKELKKLGKDWELQDEKEFKNKEEEVTNSAEELGDYIHVGDVRQYLSSRGEDIEIEILGEDPDGSFYARRTGYGGIFKVPAQRMQYIGKEVNKEDKTKSKLEDIINTDSSELNNIDANKI